jgi:hypothetical protein
MRGLVQVYDGLHNGLGIAELVLLIDLPVCGR